MILPSRESELLHHYLAQIAVLNKVTQHHFVSINAGIYEGTPKQNYETQLEQVRQAYKRLVEHRQAMSLQSAEQVRSPFPMAIAAGSGN